MPHNKLNISGAKADILSWVSHALSTDEHNMLRNVSRLPCLYKHVALMPDAHLGIGSMVGSVIEKQIFFYMPELKAFYLVRNASRNVVRVEKTRTFAGAKTIDIRAAEPEIIFQDGGRTAIMRFRKKYRVENNSSIRRGEVVQELRWQQTNRGWKIFSERDIKVIS